MMWIWFQVFIHCAPTHPPPPLLSQTSPYIMCPLTSIYIIVLCICLLNYIGIKRGISTKTAKVSAFIFSYVVFTSVLYFFIWLWITVWCPSISDWRTHYSISCRDSFFFWKIVLPDIEFLAKDSFTGYRIPGWKGFFSFRIFNIHRTAFRSARSLRRNLLGILPKSPCMWPVTSFAAFKILSGFSFWQFDMCLGTDLPDCYQCCLSQNPYDVFWRNRKKILS